MPVARPRRDARRAAHRARGLLPRADGSAGGRGPRLTGAAVAQGDRIATLDLIRGVAVMGILLMNIQSFALPGAAYLNPAAAGGRHGADLAVWAVEFVLVDGKMRGLFSWLFGASLLLVVERAEAAARSGAAVHFRRMGWLLVFGLAHFLLVWDGDILVHYALVGAVAFAFRTRPPHALIAAAAALLVVQSLLSLAQPLAADDIAAQVADAHPTDIAREGWRTLNDDYGVPARTTEAAEIAIHRGNYAAQVAYRMAEMPRLIGGTLWSVGAETLAYMLLGMAALRIGLLTGGWSRSRYWRWAAAGFGIGMPLGALLAAWLVARGFGPVAIVWSAFVLEAPLRLAMIAGWACLIPLALSPAGWLGRRVTAAGRTAFSNYLATSLVCAGLFDGLGWFGAFSRAELLVVVMAVWALILAWSQPWLARFRYGPFEWAWRSLARGRLVPMLGAAASARYGRS